MAALSVCKIHAFTFNSFCFFVGGCASEWHTSSMSGFLFFPVPHRGNSQGSFYAVFSWYDLWLGSDHNFRLSDFVGSYPYRWWWVSRKCNRSLSGGWLIQEKVHCLVYLRDVILLLKMEKSWFFWWLQVFYFLSPLFWSILDSVFVSQWPQSEKI